MKKLFVTLLMAGMLLSSPVLVADANASGTGTVARIIASATTGAAIGTWMAGPIGTFIGGFLGGAGAALGEFVIHKVIGN